ncbi:FimV/HubP family polar landmark protein [Undibacterium sp. Di24W]|uniref:FimV/HubP family polar landmark protein n=1 Tax=Undibacterium sp. Di24W TaxID=3413033 RepID=UPI003BF08576
MTKLRAHTRKHLSFLSTIALPFVLFAYYPTSSFAQSTSPNSTESNALLSTIKEVQPANPNTSLHSNLHQEVNALLAENSRINQEKKFLLESDAQKIFWTQCLVGLMSLFMLISLFSFWRLHAKAAFNNGLAELSTGLRQFQDSILSFIDTRQLAQHSVVSSFHSSVMEQGPETLQTATITKTNLNPNTEQEMSQVKNFVDAWLNVYTPGSSAHDRYVETTKNRPSSPLPWLSMIKGFRQENDQSNFESIRKEIKKLFNINVPSWNDLNDEGQKQIADYPHVLNKILELWHGDNIATYLERLLANSRINGRQGFDITLYEHLENLMKLANDPNRPRDLDQLKKHPLAAFLFANANSAANASANQTKHAKPAQTNQSAITKKTNISAANSSDVATQALSISDTSSIPENISTAYVLAAAHTQGEQEKLARTSQKISYPHDTELKETSVQVPHASEPQEEKPTLPAYEVRLKLALAYIDMGDSEGACLLLEDVIRDAPEDQKTYARKLLSDLEEKIAAY